MLSELSNQSTINTLQSTVWRYLRRNDNPVSVDAVENENVMLSSLCHGTSATLVRSQTCGQPAPVNDLSRRLPVPAKRPTISLFDGW